jgi:translation initiation factor 4A
LPDINTGEESKNTDEENKNGEEAEEFFETNWDMEVNKFDDMGLKEEVLRGIYAYGFKEPSPIQTKGILPVI